MASTSSSIQPLSQVYLESIDSDEPTLDSDLQSSRQRRTTSDIWSHTRPIKDGEETYKGRYKLLYCRHCSETNTYVAPSTTNLGRHLEKVHSIVSSSSVPLVRQQAEKQLQSLVEKLGVESHQTDKAIIDEALVSLVVVRSLPFNIAQWPEFHAYSMALNPEATSILAKTHTQLPKLISESWSRAQDVVRRKLQSSLSKIHLSLDVWTSPNRHLLLGICAHFVDFNEEKFQKALLALRTISNHSG
jgi:hypothetical protein